MAKGGDQDAFDILPAVNAAVWLGKQGADPAEQGVQGGQQCCVVIAVLAVETEAVRGQCLPIGAKLRPGFIAEQEAEALLAGQQMLQEGGLPGQRLIQINGRSPAGWAANLTDDFFVALAREERRENRQIVAAAQRLAQCLAADGDDQVGRGAGGLSLRG